MTLAPNAQPPQPPSEEMCGCGRPLHYTNPEIEREVRSLSNQYGPCLRVVTNAGTFFIPRHFMALHYPLTVSELASAAKEYGFAQVEFCPHCHHDLTAMDEYQRPKMIPDTFPPEFYEAKIGVEVRGVYDGVLFWQCPSCNGRWHRFPEDDYRYARADEYMNA